MNEPFVESSLCDISPNNIVLSEPTATGGPGREEEIIEPDKGRGRRHTKKNPETEPEPVPLFSCIYCVKEYLVFSRLSAELLAKKYIRCIPLPGWVYRWKGDNSQSLNSFRFSQPSGAHSFALNEEKEPQQSPRAQKRQSLEERQLLLNLGTCLTDPRAEHKLRTSVAPRIVLREDIDAQQSKDQMSNEMHNLIKAKGKSMYMPQLSDKTPGLYWMRCKCFIMQRNKEALQILYEPSAASNTNLRSVCTPNVLSVKWSEAEFPANLQQSTDHCLQHEMLRDELDKGPDKAHIHALRGDDISFSSSEHDIYSPEYDSEKECDDSYLERIVEASRALGILSPQALPPDSRVTPEPGPLANQHSNALSLPRATQMPAAIEAKDDYDWNVNDADDKAHAHTVYKSLTNASSIDNHMLLTMANGSPLLLQDASLPYTASVKADYTFDNDIAHERKSATRMTSSRKTSELNTPTVSQCSFSISHLRAAAGHSLAPPSQGKGSGIGRCTSSRQLKPTRNIVSRLQESKTGYMKKVALKGTQSAGTKRPPLSRSNRQTREQQSKAKKADNKPHLGIQKSQGRQEREMHYESIISQKNPGTGIPLFVKTATHKGFLTAQPSERRIKVKVAQPTSPLRMQQAPAATLQRETVGNSRGAKAPRLGEPRRAAPNNSHLNAKGVRKPGKTTRQEETRLRRPQPSSNRQCVGSSRPLRFTAPEVHKPPQGKLSYLICQRTAAGLTAS